MKKVVNEHFETVKDFVDTIFKRKPNSVFERENLSSSDGDYGFTKTKSLDEALDLMKNGYREPLTKIKSSLDKAIKSKGFSDVPKKRPQNSVVGFVPHVPNSILNLPQSMINIENTPMKVKVINIKYDMSINAGTGASEIEQAGIAVLNIVNFLELRGFRVNLDCMPFNGEVSKEFACVSVKLKDSRQPIDVLKLCFPLTHPSFFRRLGFRWLETVPQLSAYDFTGGYGRAIANKDYDEAKEYFLKHTKELTKDTYYFNVNMARRANYDIKKMAEIAGLTKLVKM